MYICVTMETSSHDCIAQGDYLTHFHQIAAHALLYPRIYSEEARQNMRPGCVVNGNSIKNKLIKNYNVQSTILCNGCLTIIRVFIINIIITLTA